MSHTVQSDSKGNFYIIVKSGDSWWGIADEFKNQYGYNTNPTSLSSTLASLNNKTTNSIIYPGDIIIIKKGYKISYFANGSTGVPGVQYKKYGINLTLSSTKPVKSGYVFQGWNSSGYNTTVTHQPGATYSGNANLNLYAVWTASTYTVTYDANGGTGAPSPQTKTHGTNLTLSLITPTRTNYSFVGWSTSATDTTSRYLAGGSYTSNANVTLYAIWSLNYRKPVISDLKIERCDRYGNYNFSGYFAHIQFKWTSEREFDRIAITSSSRTDPNKFHPETFSDPDSTSTPLTPVIRISVNSDRKSGTANFIFMISADPDEESYDITVSVSDSLGSTRITKNLNGANMPIDLKYGGSGISFGGPAEDDGCTIYYPTKLAGGLAPVKLSLDSDDLDYAQTPGIYYIENYSNYAHRPSGAPDGTITLEVYAAGGSGQLMQRFTVCNKTASATYERFFYGGNWGDWIKAYDFSLGTIISNSLNVQITSASSDLSSHTRGAYITVPAGTYVITAIAFIATSSTGASDSRVNEVSISNTTGNNDASNSGNILARERVAGFGNFTSLSVTDIQSFSSETRLHCLKTSNRTENATATTFIKAVRIK